jgi:prenyltransferase beta subunit
MAYAEEIAKCSQPILLLGNGHEVLDRLYGFNPISDFIPSVERYLWALDETLQIFSHPHPVPLASGRFEIYANHITYDAYRLSSLPPETQVLGTNYPESGAQLLWFRDYSKHSQIYYWGLDQIGNLNQNGWKFCENLIHWLLRPTLQQRLSDTLSAWQLPLGTNEDFWFIQGGGGFGYPLEPSLRFSYYVTDMVEAFGLPVNLTNFDTWLLGCYNSELGCFEDLASSQFHDRCMTTAMSVLMAEDLGVLNQLNQTQIGNYLRSCYDPVSGGFFIEPGSSQTSLSATRYALQSLSVLEQIPLLNTQDIIGYIANCQELNPQNLGFGGFYSSNTNNLSSSLVYAADAVIALDILAALNEINQTALLTFIAHCEDPSGSAIFDTSLSMDANEWILGTSCAIQVLTLLNSQGLFETSLSREFILANQYPNGGWGRGDMQHDFHNSPDETWSGVQALALTGGLGTTETNLTTYLSHCCTGWGGATEPLIFGDFLTSVEIILALSQVNALHTLNLTAYLEYLENSWSQSRTSFVAHQLPSVVGTDTDTPTPDRIAIQTATFGPLYHYAYGQLLITLNLSDIHWTIYASLLRQEIESCQSGASGYTGMLGLHHLYVGQESDLTFRFDTTCWNLIAHNTLGGVPTDFDNSTAILAYLSGCLHTNTTQQFFYDTKHSIPIPDPWHEAEGYLAETWLGLQAYSYLNPALTDLNGEKLASYVLSCLHENVSLSTIYYAIEILNFLVETDLNSDAFNLLNVEGIQSKILAAFTYDGLVLDSTLPPGKWMPYLVNLGLQLIHRLKLLPQLDVNPLLNITDIVYPTGSLYLGSNITLSATLRETRWGQLSPIIQTQTQIFNATFITSHITNTEFLEILITIPVTVGALGPQNLSLLAHHLGAIPHYSQFIDICTGWGKLTSQSFFSHNSTIPRSIPLEITIELGLAGASSLLGSFTSATVSITIETTAETYLATHQSANNYTTSIPTNHLAPTLHSLRINASAPYCTFNTTTEFITVLVFDTHLTLEQIVPATPVLFDPVLISIGLWNDSGFPLDQYQLHFNITRPSETVPFLSLNATTDDSGLSLCMWTPDVLGQWQIVIEFCGADMFNASQSEITVQIHRRQLACSITVLPSSTLHIGNQSLVQVTVTDYLNGSLRSNLAISLYEKGVQLDSAITDKNGEAICQWLITAPVGLRSLQVEITETSVYEPLISSPIMYLIQDTTTIFLSTTGTDFYVGETLVLNVSISASASPPPNGTASLYWDGLWHHDFSIIQGFGVTSIPTEYSERVGDHSIAVLFGHMDDPDSYLQNYSSLHVNLKEVIIPTITLTITPHEIDDSLIQPTLTIIVRLSYQNDSAIHGISANLTVQLQSQGSLLPLALFIVTDSSGRGNLTLTTPEPGLYTVIVLFTGQPGFAPCSGTTPLLVHYSPNLLGDIFSFLLFSSVVVLIIGLISGIFAFSRIQKRLHEFLQRIQPSREAITDMSTNLLLADYNHRSEAENEGDAEFCDD